MKVDGGMTKSDLCMQFQADILNIQVHVATMAETTALGAAFAAGLAVGVWTSPESITRLSHNVRSFHPQMSTECKS